MADQSSRLCTNACTPPAPGTTTTIPASSRRYRRRRPRRLGTVASAAATIAATSLAVFTLKSSGTGGGGSRRPTNSSPTTVDAFCVPAPVHPRGALHYPPSSGARTAAGARSRIVTEGASRRRSGGGSGRGSDSSSGIQAAGPRSNSEEIKSLLERKRAVVGSGSRAGVDGGLTLAMICPEESVEGVHGEAAAAVAATTTKTNGAAVPDLSKLKLPELKALYKGQGGKPGAMRKAELLEKLKAYSLVAGTQQQGGADREDSVLRSTDEETAAARIALLPEREEQGREEDGRTRRVGYVEPVNGCAPTTSPRTSSLTPTEAVGSEEDLIPSTTHFTSPSAVMAASTALASAGMRKQLLSPDDALDRVVDQLLREQDAIVTPASSTGDRDRCDNSGAGEKSSSSSRLLLPDAAEQSGVKDAPNVRPAAAVAAAARVRGFSAAAAAAAAAARVAEDGQSSSVTTAKRHAEAVRSRAANAWRQSADAHPSHILPTEVFIGHGGHGRTGSIEAVGVAGTAEEGGEEGSMMLRVGSGQQLGGGGETSSRRSHRSSSPELANSELEGQGAVVMEVTAAAAATSLQGPNGVQRRYLSSPPDRDLYLSSIPVSDLDSAGKTSEGDGEDSNDRLSIKRATATAKGATAISGEHTGEKNGERAPSSRHENTPTATAKEIPEAGEPGDGDDRGAAEVKAIRRATGGRGNGFDVRPSRAGSAGDRGGRGGRSGGGGWRHRRMPKMHNPWARAGISDAEEWISGRDDDIVEDFLVNTMEKDDRDGGEDGASDPLFSRNDRFVHMPNSPVSLYFLGTASCIPSTSRGVSCTVLRMQGDLWMFDVGEGTQIQIQRSSMKPTKISKIFITHAHGDHSFGLPGMLCLMGQNYERNQGKHVEIYGPTGLRAYLRAAMRYTYSRVAVPYVVHELRDVPHLHGDYSPEPEEFYLNLGQDSRYGEQRGGRDIYPDSNAHYEIINDGRSIVRATAMKHGVPCVGYCIEEPTKPGRLKVEAINPMLEENKQAIIKATGRSSVGWILGALKGLKPGESLTLPGTDVNIDYDRALDPASRGRKAGIGSKSWKMFRNVPHPEGAMTLNERVVVILGDTCDAATMVPLAQDADVVVHEATNTLLYPIDQGKTYATVEGEAIDHGHSTPLMAAAFATRVKAKMLVLNHFSARYKGDSSDASVAAMMRIERQAVRASGLERHQVVAAWDLLDLPVLSGDTWKSHKEKARYEDQVHDAAFLARATDWRQSTTKLENDADTPSSAAGSTRAPASTGSSSKVEAGRESPSNLLSETMADGGRDSSPPIRCSSSSSSVRAKVNRDTRASPKHEEGREGAMGRLPQASAMMGNGRPEVGSRGRDGAGGLVLNGVQPSAAAEDMTAESARNSRLGRGGDGGRNRGLSFVRAMPAAVSKR